MMTEQKGSTAAPALTASNLKQNILINILNVFGYLLNLSTSYLGGVAGWFGGTSNVELSNKYQTLITPASVYFGYIWGLIFLSQGIFAAMQMLPRFRNQPLVQQGVGFWYFIMCVATAIWTITFGYELMVTAFIAMVAILLSLLTILNLQWQLIDEEERKKSLDTFLIENNAVSIDEEDLTAPPPSLSYWVMRFPFALSAGWIALATPLMLCVVLVSKNVTIEIELWVSVLGLSILFGGCMGLLLRQDKGAPSYVVPAVVAYASAGIMWELVTPSDFILGRHEEASINLVKNVAGFSAVCLLITIVSRFIAIFLRDKICYRRQRNDESDDGISYTGELGP